MLPPYLIAYKLFPLAFNKHYLLAVGFIALIGIWIGELCVKRLSFKMLLILGITGWVIKSFVIVPVMLYFDF